MQVRGSWRNIPDFVNYNGSQRCAASRGRKCNSSRVQGGLTVVTSRLLLLTIGHCPSTVCVRSVGDELILRGLCVGVGRQGCLPDCRRVAGAYGLRSGPDFYTWPILVTLFRDFRRL